jgi:hypothetical protein
MHKAGNAYTGFLFVTVGLFVPIAAFGQQPNSLANTTPTAMTAQVPGNTLAPQIEFAPLTTKQKVKRRALRLIEPVTLINSAFSAGIDQWRDVPHAWGQGAEGYAIRFGSAEGFTAAHNTIALGFDLAMHLDPRYRRMPGAPFKTRLWHSVSQSFLAYKDGGGRTVNVSEIAGNFGAGFVANLWEPAGLNTTGEAIKRGSLGFIYHTAKNVVREFLPDLLHRHGQATAFVPNPHS